MLRWLPGRHLIDIEVTHQFAARRNPMTSNVEATRKGYEAFQRGDIPALMRDLIDDDCTWITPGPQDKLPWAGTFRGKQQIANFFVQVGENLEFSEFAPREMIEQGDTVVVLGTLTARAKRTGKTVKNEWAHVFKYRGGKAVYFQEYIDTAADVAAMT
ncbi:MULTISPECIES: nuclear transport factor 2 family protein [unclassified Bradyrhizobium]|uniref:nuclear transport factor 2 family protein n=1 Tax=unclassified Bradyrhizobium TaxID=2631580 RepID=UPI001BA484D4|nr:MULTISPECIES: nuclear transport factor 2 family protein [unclassified Bradyrhizobium]MBR1204926.1 nuclear transport factor 2 family protein [Bradyrhizobium sp. AUGA SZCCT0124]MBR1312012.1 nuclear transport factor 2 family protein [Bradyrhizobium sp. AUGA SZCCT0051]MBR1343742.1 nuclear transport factor 2 family protein [Bradyrhizobium sp. AUGA SZCCT0105]MBR1358283.1 nuclear transport factor 2 family protein [Bradyrhizobium sp. AUGA SZCCT0045]